LLREIKKRIIPDEREPNASNGGHAWHEHLPRREDLPNGGDKLPLHNKCAELVKVLFVEWDDVDADPRANRQKRFELFLQFEKFTKLNFPHFGPFRCCPELVLKFQRRET
jgi:hypothetical protein